MLNIGPFEAALIAAAALLVFGAKLPALARDVGRAWRAALDLKRKAFDEVMRDVAPTVRADVQVLPVNPALRHANVRPTSLPAVRRLPDPRDLPPVEASLPAAAPAPNPPSDDAQEAAGDQPLKPLEDSPRGE